MKVKNILRCAYLAILIYLGHLTTNFCMRETDGFMMHKITSQLPYNPEWDTTKPIDLSPIANQKFRYLDSGGQAFAFISEDGQWVLKFFKNHFRGFPSSWFSSTQREKRFKKLKRDFTSYKIAFEDLQEETGVIAVHLNKTTHLHKQVTIIDRLGIEHVVDLDNSEFALQKRATLVFPYIESLMANEQDELAKQAISELLSVMIRRCSKGVLDEDAHIQHNFGFIGTSAYIIDIGRFRRDPNRQNKQVYARDIRKASLRLKIWLDEHYPELSQYLEGEIQREEKI